MTQPKRKTLCPSCIDEEMFRASRCYDQSKAAAARGEEPKCTCPPLPCDIDPEHGSSEAKTKP